MIKSYKGNPPDGWDELFETREFYGSEWRVFTRDTDQNGRYLSVKLAANDYVDNKANYWLSWDKHKNRLTSRGMDSKLLKDNRPDLHAVLIKNLNAWA